MTLLGLRVQQLRTAPKENEPAEAGSKSLEGGAWLELQPQRELHLARLGGNTADFAETAAWSATATR